ncbi:MAG: diguanylate cyclase [Terriglobia bacterium]|jgi:diguanylate cyclase (GGDEF)-like protein
MGSLPFDLLQSPALPWLVIIILLVLFLEHFHRQRVGREKNADLQWFSELDLFGRRLDKSPDPKQMADLTMQRTTEMLGSADSYILVQTTGSDAISHVCAQGLSARTVERLSSEPLRSYLASCGERWGNLLVFPDLSLPSVGVAWQRDALFQELREVCAGEGLRTQLLVGLQVRDSSYGVLLVGSRKPRIFHPNQLRLLLAIGSQLGRAMENWSLHRAAERHNQELRLLHRVSGLLRATFDLESQVEILREELKGVLGTTNFSLSLQDSPEGPLKTVVPFETADAEDTPEAAEVDGLAEFVCQGRSPLLLNQELPAAARRLGIKSVDGRLRTWCGVPIHFSDGALGVLAAGDFDRENTINQEQFELIQVLADEAASAIENARLFQKERRRSSHLALLNELAQKAASVLNPNELLGSICGEVRSAFDRDLARIEVVDLQNNELVVQAQAGYGTELLGRRARCGQGLSGTAAMSREPVLANSVLRDLRYVALHPGVRSALSLPLKYRDDLLGVLSLESFREHSFSQQDVLTLQSLADQLASALHNARAYQSALDQAITDGLTGLKTHRYFMEALDVEWRRSTRTGRPFSVIMMDLDGFKRVNDHGGHLEGDKVLAAVAALLEARSRQSNVVARYGGDEFALLMPETNPEQAEILAERLRAALEADHFLRAHGVTASFGIATFPDHGPTQGEIVSLADSGMYLAKNCNGNCVKLATLSPKPEDGEQQLLEARLGVAVKRMFSTDPGAISQYRHRLERMLREPAGESPSLLDTITALAYAVEAKDPYMKDHIQKVSRLAAQIAMQLGLSEAEIEEIRLAGIVHDVGKIHVPDHVLLKPTLLTAQEYETVKSHAAWGAKILEPLKVTAIERIVRHHHESFDGQGYPDNLKGDQIPLGARIIAVADAFHAMVTARAYRKARAPEEALAELRRCRGTQFDPLVVDAFLRSIQSLGGQPRSDSVVGVVI